ncbi:MAG: hypothetical protein BWY25_03084 [Chloroflexi bacterium ADurb.Bin222]|nr:MAG: hypothetical protein BWY25_03084 [Chloroflexi bacterium ADurb.Bin222]
MFDLRLIRTLPTLTELLGPDWETCTLKDARRVLTESAKTLNPDLRREVRTIVSFSWRWPFEIIADQTATTGERLSFWRKVLENYTPLIGVGPLRRKLLNRLFEIVEIDGPSEFGDFDLEVEVALLPTLLPTLAELLGPDWKTCSWDDALDVLRAWLGANPSLHGRGGIRALMAVSHHFPNITLGIARERLPEAVIRQIGPKSYQILEYLLEISLAQAPVTTPTASPVEQLAQLHERLPAAHRSAWISLGQRMLSRAEDAPTDLADIQSQLSPDQIILWLKLGEQMLRRGSPGEEAH